MFPPFANFRNSMNNCAPQSVRIFLYKHRTQIVFLFVKCLVLCIKMSETQSVKKSLSIFVFKYQLHNFHEKLCNVKCFSCLYKYVIKIVMLFAKCIAFCIQKRFPCF